MSSCRLRDLAAKVHDYLASVPVEARAALEKLRKIIKGLARPLVVGLSISTMTPPGKPPHVALADYFAGRGTSGHPLRIRLTSGEEFDCHAPVFDADQLVLVVTTFEGVVRKVRPAEVEALHERRPRWPAYASLGLVTVVPGAGISAFLVPLLSPLTALD